MIRLVLRLLIVVAEIGGAQQGRPSAGGPASSKSSEFVREMLVAHNNARKRVGLPALAWSSVLAAQAQQWADTLLTRHQLFHRPESKYGENLFEINGARSTPAEVVGEWTSESRNYNYRTNTCRGVCGHYTQIIWRQTREVGCAMAGDSNREVWVCNYNPPGNWAGQRPY